MAIDVFLSVGRTANEEQETFVRAFERCLIDNDLRPRTLGRNEWSSEQPLTAIKKRMTLCAGTAVVALERTQILYGIDLPRGDEDGRLRDETLPTIWNQIEAAMAYSLGLPLLVIAEQGLRSEGLLEARYDWSVERLRLDVNALREPRCIGVIDDWAQRVKERHKVLAEAANDPPVMDVADKSIAELVGELRPGQLRATVAAAFGAFATVAGAAYTLGSRVAGG